MLSKRFLVFCASLVVLGSCSNISEAATQNEGFYDRSELIIDHTADLYQPPSMNIGDPEKYYWPKAMARFERYGHDDPIANDWIHQLSPRSPFHFTLVGMARLLSLYPDAPALAENRLLILQKVFERTDAHNAWTSEGTENHIAMDRTSGYIFAQHALDYPDQFPDAPEKLELMKQWIQQFSHRMYQYGTGEWNSSTYQTYHIISWLNLYDFADDPDVKLMARAVLDYYVAEMALHYSWGTYGGSEKRGKGASDQNLSASSYLCWLWFGSHLEGNTFQHRGTEYIQSMHAVTSMYRPPIHVLELARKQNPEPMWFTGSKPSYLYEDPGFVKQFFYKGESFTLGSSVSRYGGWTGSTSQLVNWKLVVRRDDSPVPYEISGSGRFHDDWSGKRVDPFTQWAQHKNVLIQMTRMPENVDSIILLVKQLTEQWARNWEQDFRMRFPDDHKGNVVNFGGNIAAENRSFINFPADARIELSDSVVWVDLGNAWLAVIPLSENRFASYNPILDYRNRQILTDSTQYGQMCGFAIETFDASRFSSWEAFKDQWISSASIRIDGTRVEYTALEGDTIVATFQSNGTFAEALYDWGYGVARQATMPKAPPLRQPDWPSGEGFGRMAEVRVNGQKVDFAEPWPVYGGPGFTLQNSVMTLSGPRSIYKVDYSGELPVYSITPAP